MTLTADVVGDAQSIAFYQASGANAAFSSATAISGTPTQNSDGSWSLAVAAPSSSAPVTYFAVATDQSDIETDPTALGVNPLTVGSFTGTANSDGSVTLTASGIMDWSSAATGVTFYLDTQGTGVLDIANDTPYAATQNDDGSWSATISLAGTTGPQTFFAVATDSSSNTSAALATTVAGPWLDSLTATPIAWDDTGTLTQFSLTATADPYSSDAIASVTFYQDNGSGVFSSDDTVLATVESSVDGLWTTPSLTAPTAGAQTFWAVATDADGLTSSPIALYTDPLTISSATATMNPQSEYGYPSVSLTASNLLDWGNAITGVTYYIDTSGTGIYDPSTATSVGSGTQNTDGSWTLANVNLAELSGPQTFFAIATDGTNTSDPLAITLGGPAVGGLTASPLNSDGSLTLTASGLSDDVGQITSVAFYEGTVGDSTLLGTATSTSNGWNVTVPSSDLSGSSESFYAVATDNYGLTSAPAALTVPPLSIGQFTTSSTSTTSGVQSLTLSASDLMDWDGSAWSVSFYQDNSGTGVFDPTTATLLGSVNAFGDFSGNEGSGATSGSVSDGVFNLTLTTTGQSGTQTFFAVATDGYAYSSPAAVSVGPFSIGDFSDSTSDSTVTLTAGGIVDWGGSVSNVTFYQDNSFTGVFDPAAATVLGTGTSDGNGNWNFSISASELCNSQPIFAVATDSNGNEAAPVMLTYSASGGGTTVLYFDPEGNVGNDVDVATGAGLGGSGTWDTISTDTDWYNPLTNSLVAWDADSNSAEDVAIFEGTGGTVAIGASSTISAQTITFASDGYTLTQTEGEGSLSLGDNASIDVAAGASATIDAPIAGSGGTLNEFGSGLLQLDGATSDIATIDVNGTLQMGSNTNAVVSLNGGTLDLNGSNLTVGGVLGSSGLVTNYGTAAAVLTDGTYGGSLNFGGSIEDGAETVGLIVDGNLTLSGTNAYSGGTTVSSGGSLAGTTSSMVGNIVDDGGVTFAQSAAGAYSGNVSGTGSVTINGSAVVTFTGDNSYSGATTIDAGTLQLGSSTALTSGSVALSGGTLDLDGQSVSSSVSVVVDSSGSTIANNSTTTAASFAGTISMGSYGLSVADTENLTLSGAISGSGALTQAGTAILQLSGSNTYSGSTVIGGGTLQLGSTGALPDTSGISSTSSGTLDLDGQSLGSSIHLSTFDGTIIDSGAAATISGTISEGGFSVGGTVSVTLSGVISGTGSLTDNDTGTLDLTAANTFSGSTVIDSGILQLGNASALADTSAVSSTSSGTLDLDGHMVGSATTTPLVGFDGTILNSSTTAATFAGSIDDTSATTSFTVGGTHSTKFSGIVGWTGGYTTTMIVAFSSTLSLTTTTGGEFEGNLTVNSGTVSTTSYTANIDVLSGSGGIISGSGTLNIGENNDGGTYSGAVEGSLALSKYGTGIETFAGTTFSYTGGTALYAGAVQLNSSLDSYFGNGSIVFDGSGATLDLDGATIIDGPITVNGSGNFIANSDSSKEAEDSGAAINLNSYGLTFAGTGSILFTGVISGTGSLVQTNSGTVFLSGANTYSGGTTVSDGILEDESHALPGNILDNANVEFYGSFTYSGIVSGSGSVSLAQNSNITFAGANDYTGGTSFLGRNGGALTGTTSTIQGNISLGSDGLVTFAQTTDGTYSGDLTGDGVIFLSASPGTVTLTISGNNSDFEGGYEIDSGTLKFANSNALASSWIDYCASAGTLDLNGLTFGSTSDPILEAEFNGTLRIADLISSQVVG